jgi:hypothetical protein
MGLAASESVWSQDSAREPEFPERIRVGRMRLDFRLSLARIRLRATALHA